MKKHLILLSIFISCNNMPEEYEQQEPRTEADIISDLEKTNLVDSLTNSLHLTMLNYGYNEDSTKILVAVGENQATHFVTRHRFEYVCNKQQWYEITDNGTLLILKNKLYEN